MENNFKKLSGYQYMLYNQNGFKQAILDALTDKGCKELDWKKIKTRVYKEYNQDIKPQLANQYPTHYPCIMIPQFFAWYEINRVILSFIYESDFGKNNQWHDATEYPPIDEDVLVEYPYEHGFVVAYYDGEDWYITETGRLIRPIRWMPIPAEKKTK